MKIVDVGTLAAAELGPETSTCFSAVPDTTIVKLGLMDRATLVNEVDRRRDQRLWQRLRAENAELRIITAHGLASAPITQLDETITSFVTDDWQTYSRVIGRALRQLNISLDALLWSRLSALVHDGILECRGEGGYHETWVRWPPGHRTKPA